MEKREQPSWTPYAYIGAGIVGFVVTGLALFVGQFGFFDAIIVGLSLGAIIVGIKQLRDRGKNPESRK